MPEVHEINILFDGIEYCLLVPDEYMEGLPVEDGGIYSSCSQKDHDHYKEVLEPYRKDIPVQYGF